MIFARKPTRAVSILHLRSTLELHHVVCPAAWSDSAGSVATAGIECPFYEGFSSLLFGMSS